MERKLKRMIRVTELMASAHAGQAEKFSLFAMIIELSALVLSVIVLSLTFSNEGQINTFGGVIEILAPSLPYIGVLVFVLTIIQLKFNPKGKSDSHYAALDTLFSLKNELRQYEGKTDSEIESVIAMLSKLYELTMNSCIHIPESLFIKLKAKHRRKVRISRILDSRPSANLFLLRLTLWYRDNYNIIREKIDDN